jgi:NAD(P)-dependent dehydrogenase (short-subunit alcohol dehydrogenase family)
MTRFALITGGSRGLGAHLVRRFWLEGYSLLVVARNQFDVHAMLNDLPRRHEQSAVAFRCDLADPGEIAKLVERIRATSPSLDVLVNNAAIQGPIGPLCVNDSLAWQKTLQVNLLAPVALCQGLIPLMKRSRGASIINLSGGGATGPRSNFSAYATSKAGLVRFSETIAAELKGDGVRVNCIAPGPMKTAMLQEVLESGDAAGSEELSSAGEVFDKGGVSLDRVADLAFFLASDASKGISGKLISAVWDKWEEWPKHLNQLCQSDIYTLRRIVGRDRGFVWGDR